MFIPRLVFTAKADRTRFLFACCAVSCSFFAASSTYASDQLTPHLLDLTSSKYGIVSLVLFVLAFLLVMGEEPLRLRKSKPMLLAGALIWVLVALAYTRRGDLHSAELIFRDSIEHFTELFLFLLAAMTYVNAMTERNVFPVLRQWMVAKRLTLRGIYWLTGILTFVASAFLANLAVALLVVTIVMSVGVGNRAFIVASCVNIVVAANAGGLFTPFGDITALMIWQRNVLDFSDFFRLLLPAVVCWLIPAVVLSFTFGKGSAVPSNKFVVLKPGAWTIVGLFVMTLFAAFCFEQFLFLPAVVGMMTGLGLLKLYGYKLKMSGVQHFSGNSVSRKTSQYDIFRSLERSEWDTLMFLLGIVVAISGVYAMGYLSLTSEYLYGQLSPTVANVVLGVISAFVENVPVVYAVLGMEPDISRDQWLLVTLAAGAGGSLLSIGSIAGVAVMGQARGVYTFMAHLRWTWVIAIGYAVSIWLHLALSNAV